MHHRLRNEDGIALPVAVIVLSIVLLLTGISLVSSIQSRNRVDRDFEAKMALQAAQAGVDLAKDRMNSGLDGLGPLLTVATPCINLSQTVDRVVFNLVGGVLTGLLGGYCPQTEDTYSSGATSKYTLNSSGLLGGLLGGLGDRTIYSEGKYGDTTRRVAATIAYRNTTQSYFGSYGISSYKPLVLENNFKVAGGGARSNGDLTIRGSADVCGGPVTSGPSATSANPIFNNGGTYCGVAPNGVMPAGVSRTTSAFQYPTLTAPSSYDNSPICGGLLGGGTARYKCNTSLLRPPTIDFDDSNTYTIPDGTYYFCRWSMYGGGGKIVIPAGATVKLYLASPENCGGIADTPYQAYDLKTQFRLENGFTVDNRNADPKTFQVYVLGSPNYTTDAAFIGNNSGTAHMTVFAPNSLVRINNNARVVGALSGDEVQVGGGATLTRTDSVNEVGTSGAKSYLLSNFRECAINSQNPPTAPNAGCAPVN